jgi:SAM-dependent methyltransferase
MEKQVKLLNLAKKLPLLIKIARKVTGKQVQNSEPFFESVRQKQGLELGGTSAAFSDTGILPLYSRVASLDNAVYSSATPFLNDTSGNAYHFHPRKAAGRNLILESAALKDIQDASYDFVLACHCLEHCANPIKALKEWQRVLRPGGTIIVILPHYRHTFDHLRPLTSVDHMLEDSRRDVGEDDRTHIEEMSSLLDFSRTLATPEKLLPELADNFRSRCVHHHVFDETNSRALLEASGLTVSVAEFVKPYHIVFLTHVSAG